MSDDRFRIIHNDSGEPVELDGRVDYGIEAVEREIRRRPEQFVIVPDPIEYAPNGLSVKRVLLDYEPAVVVFDIDDATRFRLALLRLSVLARNLVEIIQGGSKAFDIEEYDDAVAKLALAVPEPVKPPVTFDPDKDPF